MANGNNKTTEEIVARILQQYPNYDCSETVYIDAKTPIIIGCPTHGSFTKSNCKSYECPTCSIKRRTLAQTSNREDFIRKSIAMHGDKYDYSLVEYTTARKDVKIICKVHNAVFLQKADIHVHGKGCPLCKNDKLASDRKADIAHFILTFTRLSRSR